MPINTLGLTAAVTAFLCIWFGHVAVRKIEASAADIRIPIFIFVGAGLVVEYLSLRAADLHLEVILGIAGVTLLWDAVECLRQQKRVRRGHAPANPHNPRHAAMLASADSRATTADLLKRAPGETSTLKQG